MPASDEVFLVLREWIAKAEGDFAVAVHVLGLGESGPADAVCFHAQQCLEKYLKALLVWRGTPFPLTHAVDQLLALPPEGTHLGMTADEARGLTRYATETRYPGDYEPITLLESCGAVRIARRVRAAVRKLLPKEAVRRRRQ